MKELPPSPQQLFSLKNKVALVTGAASGIGRTLALSLAQAGATVALHGRRQDERLEASHQQIAEAGGQAHMFAAELSDVAACRNLIREIHERLSQLDILINNAGMNRRKPIEQVTDEDVELMMASNLRSAFVLSQAAHPIMTRQGGGKIVHIGSITSSYGLGEVSVYGMTKSALAHLTKSMAVEWAKDNIQVNCLAPGFIVTPLTEKSVWQDEHKSQWLRARIPAHRPGTPDDLIGTLLLLASPASDYLTGQLITVDGGFLAGGWWRAEGP